MNKERRKALQNIFTRLEDIQSDLTTVAAEEQDAFDNMPEGLQYSEKGEAIEENAQEIDAAADEVEGLMSTVEDIISR